MLLNSGKLKLNLKASHNIRNKDNNYLIQKICSDIEAKTKKINKSSINIFKLPLTQSKKSNQNPLIKTISRRNSSLLIQNISKKNSLKIKNLLDQKTYDKTSVQTAREMKTKFYIRNHQISKELGKCNDRFSGVIKEHQKIVKKILLDYKNFKTYNEEVINSNKNNYYKNVEFLENQSKVRENERKKDDEKFKKLKSSENRKLLILSPRRSKSTTSYISSRFSSPIYKSNSLTKKPSLDIIKDKENKLEKRVNYILLENKNLRYKRLKENAKIFSEKIKNLDLDCQLYEPINEITSKINLGKHILYNAGNLERIIKLQNIKYFGIGNEDYEGNGIFLKKCFDDYNFNCDKAISGYYPSYIKKEGFLHRTLIKYANLQGKYFGIPV